MVIRPGPCRSLSDALVARFRAAGVLWTGDGAVGLYAAAEAYAAAGGGAERLTGSGLAAAARTASLSTRAAQARRATARRLWCRVAVARLSCITALVHSLYSHLQIYTRILSLPCLAVKP